VRDEQLKVLQNIKREQILGKKKVKQEPGLTNVENLKKKKVGPINFYDDWSSDS